MSSKQHTFTAIIQNAGGGGAFVEVPFDVEAAFGAKRPKIKALIEGVPYRGTLVRTPALAPGASVGGPNHMLIILKGIREKIGKTFGDEISISVEADVEPRVIEIPKDLLKALKQDQDARSAFERLSYTHRKEYVNWITEAKKEETRQSRIVKMLERLKKK